MAAAMGVIVALRQLRPRRNSRTIPAMKFGLFVDPDTTRYCYLRLRRLKPALKDANLLRALAAELELPAVAGSAQISGAIERRIEELRGTKGSPWYEVPAPEILAASIFAARKRAGGAVEELFSAVSRVQELAAPLGNWLNIAGLKSYQGGVPGIGRANLVGYAASRLMSGPHIVGIEATNDTSQLASALDSTKTTHISTHASYLACTPALAAEVLWAQAAAPGFSRWDAGHLALRLKASGYGLLLVEGDAVSQAVAPREQKLDKAVIAELARAILSPTPTAK